MLSGCELIDAENICLSSQNMKFAGECKLLLNYILGKRILNHVIFPAKIQI
jgi:hypothetical protein